MANGNGIINTSINQGFGSGISIGANSNYGVGGVDSLGESSELNKTGMEDVGSIFARSEKADRPSTTMENFQEYMKDKQEQAKEAGQDLATKEKEAKEQAKKVSQSISSEELRQLEMMGIDVDTANMTDIMGMVNTLRYNAETQETAELMAKIAVDKGQLDSVTMMGGNVSVGGTKISGVSVGDILVAEETKTQEVATPKEDVTAQVKDAQDKAVNIATAFDVKLSDTEAIYLLKNDMELSKENIYKAHFSGMKLAEGISDKVLADIEPQLLKVIEQAGLEVNQESMEAAKLLMSNQVPVTTDNLRKYMDMKPFMDKTPEEAGIPDMVAEISEEMVDVKAAKLYEEVRSIDVRHIYQMATEGKTVTIASAVKYSMSKEQLSKGDIESSYNNLEFSDAKAVTAMRQMEEIRLSMTSAMAGKLIKLDMNVDTRDLTKVVAMLKNIELNMTKEAFYSQGVNPTEENVSLYQEVSAKVNAIGKAPEGIIAAPLMGEAFTIEGLHRRITPVADAENGAMNGQTNQGTQGGLVSEAQMETVRRSYESVGTAPRKDMGDSISKAFANVQDILKEMDMPVNYETQRAVRILGYNQLEITEANINHIMDYDRQVNDMLNTFYPEAVIGMIKEGINPLDVPIDELNKKIRDRNYNNGVTEAKNFATFLRDMEKQGALTSEERESYIGMYRVMEKLSKSGDREAGYLFANGSRLTVRNLITAMRSRKAAGVDIGIDDSFGMLLDVSVDGKRMDQQIEVAFGNASVGDVDEKNGLNEAYKLLKDNVEKFMEENSVEISAVNIRAVNAMLNQPGSVYSLVSELLGRMKFRNDTTEEMVDQEMENITDSISGEDIPVEFSMESILECFRGSEEMSLKYEDLRTSVTELMYQWGVGGTLSQMDIATIKTVNAGFNIMSAMAKQDKFQVPVQTEQGTRVMNLTIKKDGANPGLVQVAMDTEPYGHLVVSLKAGEDGGLYGQALSDSSEGNYALKEAGDIFKAELVAAGYNTDNVEIGSQREVELDRVDGITSDKLYQLSVTVIKALSGIL